LTTAAVLLAEQKWVCLAAAYASLSLLHSFFARVPLFPHRSWTAASTAPGIGLHSQETQDAQVPIAFGLTISAGK
jgi:hypothetical protein